MKRDLPHWCFPNWRPACSHFCGHDFLCFRRHHLHRHLLDRSVRHVRQSPRAHRRRNQGHSHHRHQSLTHPLNPAAHRLPAPAPSLGPLFTTQHTSGPRAWPTSGRGTATRTACTGQAVLRRSRIPLPILPVPVTICSRLSQSYIAGLSRHFTMFHRRRRSHAKRILSSSLSHYGKRCGSSRGPDRASSRLQHSSSRCSTRPARCRANAR